MPTYTQQSEAMATEVVKRHNARNFLSFVRLYWALERSEQIYTLIINQFCKKKQPQINKEM